ncbi:CPBP family intramembrane glutamic endopeptidase [Kordiimonas marina]|uniref:CPBP family intramembrane glutamic endopeptidase n=1 Tax=Kordiimonas marina TaxID=2872312 RepID=UPI001FF3D7B2|nr:type II CAAX endopeptidase family protein [Kordiimonas marina]MCJ9427466.1 CPBP family intramembrane metalloprotease [Kordiimonas marina]
MTDQDNTPITGQVPDAGDEREGASATHQPWGGADPAPTVAQALSLVFGFIGLQVLFGLTLGFFASHGGGGLDVGQLTLIGGGGTAVIILLYAWTAFNRGGPAFMRAVGWKPSHYSFWMTLYYAAGIYLGLRVVTALYAWAFLGEDLAGFAERAAAETFGHGFNLQVLGLWLFIAGIGPMAEEIVFRGYLQTALKARYGTWIAVTVASAVFASVHFSLTLWPIYFLLGLSFGILYHLTGSLRASMALHIFNNALALSVQAMAAN